MKCFMNKIKRVRFLEKRTQWAGLDSNQRKLPLMDLQSIPFSHSGTDPERK